MTTKNKTAARVVRRNPMPGLIPLTTSEPSVLFHVGHKKRSQPRTQHKIHSGVRKYRCSSPAKSYNPRPPRPKYMCDKLQSLKREAALVVREVRKIRRSRDVSFFEDAELNSKKHQSLTAVLKHLLAGHGGQPCPAGDRPIVRLDKTCQIRW